ncbi:MAG TPA: hypothetical protein VK191_16775 [Symbiobacteriaceae bacterium]|nr:hypothetical protein [Symbiobacteriaceae bacterium]
MSSQRKMGSPFGTRVGRAEEQFRSWGKRLEVQIRRMLIRRAYNYQDWVTAQTYRHPELEGVPGIIEQVETDFPFYLVRFPSKGESYWFPEPELTRVQPPTEGGMPGAGPGMQPGAGQGMQPGAGSEEESME